VIARKLHGLHTQLAPVRADSRVRDLDEQITSRAAALT
jgi:hypothetical protein